MKIIITSRALVASLCLFTSASLAQAQGQPIADPATGCKIWNASPGKNEEARWSGTCKDGWADGEGTLEWKTDGLFYSRVTLTGKNGVIMKEGRYFSLLDPTTLQFKHDWVPQNEHRGITVYVPDEVDLYFAGAHRDVLIPAAVDWSLAQVPLNSRRAGEWKITVKHKADGNPSWVGFKARSTSDPRTATFEYYYNSYANVLQTQWKEERLYDSQRVTRQKAERAAAMQQAAAQERSAQVDSFAKKAGISTRLAGTANLKANPYQYSGKTVGLCVVFKEMLSASTAAFDEWEIIVEGVPSTRFSAGERAYLAATVVGKKKATTPFGDASLVHLKYVNSLNVCP